MGADGLALRSPQLTLGQVESLALANRRTEPSGSPIGRARKKESGRVAALCVVEPVHRRVHDSLWRKILSYNVRRIPIPGMAERNLD